MTEDQKDKRISELEEALRSAEIAINPRDREMLSFSTWNDRLKAATDTIFTALNEPNPWMPDGTLVVSGSPPEKEPSA